MLKRILIGLVVVIFLLIGIHRSWGGRVNKMDGSAAKKEPRGQVFFLNKFDSQDRGQTATGCFAKLNLR